MNNNRVKSSSNCSNCIINAGLLSVLIIAYARNDYSNERANLMQVLRNVAILLILFNIRDQSGF